MKPETIKKLINRLNSNIRQELFHIRPLTEKVVFAKVWTEKPKATNRFGQNVGPNDFYFIKNEMGIYVAAVLDMVEDLHWYVLPEYRGKGYLTSALKEVILFHLFNTRDIQKITISDSIGKKNFNGSEKVALKVGFVKNEVSPKSEYFLEKKSYQSENSFDGKNTKFSSERVEQLKHQLQFIANSLLMIQTEIEMKMGNAQYAKELNYLVSEIRMQPTILEDFCWDSIE